MFYEEYTHERFFTEITTESDAIDLIWRSKCGGKVFECSKCGHDEFYEIKTRPEVRVCKGCKKQARVRAGTIFQSSKTPLLAWVKAIFYATRAKIGVSATDLQRFLSLKSYGRTWTMLQKIRAAMIQRDEQYQIGKGVVELDGAVFGKRETGNQCQVIVAIESKDWVDKNGKTRSKAGYAKVMVGKETKENAQALVDQGVKTGSMLNTDGKHKDLENVDHDYQVVSGNPEACDRWLPWIHRYISNTKAWINGTHHGILSKYIGRYLGEFTYRFNRRHDIKRLFHRALTACSLARPVKLCALC